VESPGEVRPTTAMSLARAAVFRPIVFDTETSVVFQMDGRFRPPRVLAVFTLLYSAQSNHR